MNSNYFSSFMMVPFLVFALFALPACSTGGLRSDLSNLPDQGPVQIELKGVPGQSDLTLYHSQTISKNLTGGEVVKKSSEITEFKVRTELAQVDPQSGDLTYRVKTVDKSGAADLHDFAVPNLDEEIEFVLGKNALVKKAGEAPRGTIFYVPPVSLPAQPVRVGDTWELNADWVSLKTGVPLQMEIVSILKGLKKCGLSTCAWIEVSGGVKILGVPSNFLASREGTEELPLRFSSRINGQILFNLEQGMIVYSSVFSEERLSGREDAVEINSCIISKVEEPENLRVTKVGMLDCAPLKPASMLK